MFRNALNNFNKLTIRGVYFPRFISYVHCRNISHAPASGAQVFVNSLNITVTEGAQALNIPNSGCQQRQQHGILSVCMFSILCVEILPLLGSAVSSFLAIRENDLRDRSQMT